MYWHSVKLGAPNSSKTIAVVGLGQLCPIMQRVKDGKTLRKMEERKSKKEFSYIKWKNADILHKRWRKEPCADQSDY